MARYAGADNARYRRVSAEADGIGIPGHRPHRRLTPYRPPLWHHDAATPAALRPQALPARGRCHGYDWRPIGQEPGAQSARRRHPLPQPGVHQEAGIQIPRLRRQRAQQGRDGQQLRLDEGLHLPRLRTRSGQAHHRKLYDGQGQRAEATQRRGSRRTLIHRVHLPAAPRLRLPLPLPETRSAAPARR